uniref:Transmembrane protein 120A n=1 Tax=Denticeps clupeoides TaxID=299321 RepID=A0AAY4A4E7_9TELE
MLFTPSSVDDCLQEWADLETDFQQVQETHRLYRQKLEEVAKLQDSCSTAITRQRKKLKELSVALEECRQSGSALSGIQENIKERYNVFYEMDSFLPKKNGLYLSLVLGNVNVTLLNKQSKFAYKDEYEKFKLYVTVLLMVFSFTCRTVVNYRVVDALFNFLLVWYYCTLTIRESVLICNGSRIKGWWVFQHYQTHALFGCLYRLRALGERHNMDITVEGFQSWMWRGLTFLLVFLLFGHFFQLYNGVTLFRMAQLPEWKEWQVLMCGSTFLVLFMGNFSTTLGVVYHKYKYQDKTKQL